MHNVRELSDSGANLGGVMLEGAFLIHQDNCCGANLGAVMHDGGDMHQGALCAKHCSMLVIFCQPFEHQKMIKQKANLHTIFSLRTTSITSLSYEYILSTRSIFLDKEKFY